MVKVCPGDVLLDKYRVERVLGEGGMGMVVAALHLELHELVALKLLHPGTTENAELVARMLREARAAVKLRSEHVARVTDVGRLQDGSPYIVMEYLQGSDLAAVIQQRGALEVQAAVDYVIQTCDAMAEAHSLGIVHRDLKPGNLFLTRDGSGLPMVKVLDFGISKIRVSSFTGGLTQENALMGSPYYMSPEQMQSARSVDHRADIWSLGVILYELVVGRPPFAGQTMAELVLEVATHPCPSVRDQRANLPERLDQIVQRCLQKDPTRRYQNVGELVADLAALAPPHAWAVIERAQRFSTATRLSLRPSASPSTMPARVSPDHPDESRAAAAESRTGGAWSETQPTRRSSGHAALILALVVTAVLVVGVVISVLRFLRVAPAPPQAATLAAPQPSFEAGAAAPASEPGRPTASADIPLVEVAPIASAAGSQPAGAQAAEPTVAPHASAGQTLTPRSGPVPRGTPPAQAEPKPAAPQPKPADKTANPLDMDIR